MPEQVYNTKENEKKEKVGNNPSLNTSNDADNNINIKNNNPLLDLIDYFPNYTGENVVSPSGEKSNIEETVSNSSSDKDNKTSSSVTTEKNPTNKDQDLIDYYPNYTGENVVSNLGEKRSVSYTPKGKSKTKESLGSFSKFLNENVKPNIKKARKKAKGIVANKDTDEIMADYANNPLEAATYAKDAESKAKKAKQATKLSNTLQQGSRAISMFNEYLNFKKDNSLLDKSRSEKDRLINYPESPKSETKNTNTSSLKSNTLKSFSNACTSVFFLFSKFQETKKTFEDTVVSEFTNYSKRGLGFSAIFHPIKFAKTIKDALSYFTYSIDWIVQIDKRLFAKPKSISQANKTKPVKNNKDVAQDPITAQEPTQQKQPTSPEKNFTGLLGPMISDMIAQKDNLLFIKNSFINELISLRKSLDQASNKSKFAIPLIVRLLGVISNWGAKNRQSIIDICDVGESLLNDLDTFFDKNDLINEFIDPSVIKNLQENQKIRDTIKIIRIVGQEFTEKKSKRHTGHRFGNILRVLTNPEVTEMQTRDKTPSKARMKRSNNRFLRFFVRSKRKNNTDELSENSIKENVQIAEQVEKNTPNDSDNKLNEQPQQKSKIRWFKRKSKNQTTASSEINELKSETTETPEKDAPKVKDNSDDTAKQPENEITAAKQGDKTTKSMSPVAQALNSSIRGILGSGSFKNVQQKLGEFFETNDHLFNRFDALIDDIKKYPFTDPYLEQKLDYFKESLKNNYFKDKYKCYSELKTLLKKIRDNIQVSDDTDIEPIKNDFNASASNLLVAIESGRKTRVFTLLSFLSDELFDLSNNFTINVPKPKFNENSSQLYSQSEKDSNYTDTEYHASTVIYNFKYLLYSAGHKAMELQQQSKDNLQSNNHFAKQQEQLCNFTHTILSSKGTKAFIQKNLKGAAFALENIDQIFNENSIQKTALLEAAVSLTKDVVANIDNYKDVISNTAGKILQSKIETIESSLNKARNEGVSGNMSDSKVNELDKNAHKQIEQLNFSKDKLISNIANIKLKSMWVTELGYDNQTYAKSTKNVFNVAKQLDPNQQKAMLFSVSPSLYSLLSALFSACNFFMSFVPESPDHASKVTKALATLIDKTIDEDGNISDDMQNILTQIQEALKADSPSLSLLQVLSKLYIEKKPPEIAELIQCATSFAFLSLYKTKDNDTITAIVDLLSDENNKSEFCNFVADTLQGIFNLNSDKENDNKENKNDYIIDMVRNLPSNDLVNFTLELVGCAINTDFFEPFANENFSKGLLNNIAKALTSRNISEENFKATLISVSISSLSPTLIKSLKEKPEFLTKSLPKIIDFLGDRSSQFKLLYSFFIANMDGSEQQEYNKLFTNSIMNFLSSITNRNGKFKVSNDEIFKMIQELLTSNSEASTLNFIKSICTSYSDNEKLRKGLHTIINQAYASIIIPIGSSELPHDLIEILQTPSDGFSKQLDELLNNLNTNKQDNDKQQDNALVKVIKVLSAKDAFASYLPFLLEQSTVKELISKLLNSVNENLLSEDSCLSLATQIKNVKDDNELKNILISHFKHFLPKLLELIASLDKNQLADLTLKSLEKFVQKNEHFKDIYSLVELDEEQKKSNTEGISNAFDTVLSPLSDDNGKPSEQKAEQIFNIGLDIVNIISTRDEQNKTQAIVKLADKISSNECNIAATAAEMLLDSTSFINELLQLPIAKELFKQYSNNKNYPQLHNALIKAATPQGNADEDAPQNAVLAMLNKPIFSEGLRLLLELLNKDMQGKIFQDFKEQYTTEDYLLKLSKAITSYYNNPDNDGKELKSPLEFIMDQLNLKSFILKYAKDKQVLLTAVTNFGTIINIGISGLSASKIGKAAASGAKKLSLATVNKLLGALFSNNYESISEDTDNSDNDFTNASDVLPKPPTPISIADPHLYNSVNLMPIDNKKSNAVIAHYPTPSIPKIPTSYLDNPTALQQSKHALQQSFLGLIGLDDESKQKKAETAAAAQKVKEEEKEKKQQQKLAKENAKKESKQLSAEDKAANQLRKEKKKQEKANSPGVLKKFTLTIKGFFSHGPEEKKDSFPIPADNQPEQLKGGLSDAEDIVSNSEELSTIPGQDAALPAINISANDIDSSDTDAPPSAVSLVHPKSDNAAYYNKHQNNVTSRPYSEGDTPLVDTQSPSNIALLSSDSVSDEIISTGSSKSTTTPPVSSKMDEIISTSEFSSSSSKGSSPAASAIAIDTSASISSVKESLSEVISGTSTSDFSTSEKENAPIQKVDLEREALIAQWQQTLDDATKMWDDKIQTRQSKLNTDIETLKSNCTDEITKLMEECAKAINQSNKEYDDRIAATEKEYDDKIATAAFGTKWYQTRAKATAIEKLQKKRSSASERLKNENNALVKAAETNRDKEIKALKNIANKELKTLEKDKTKELAQIETKKQKELNPGLLGKAANKVVNFAYVVKDKTVNIFNKPKGKPNTAHPESTIESLKAPVYVEPHSTTIAMSDDYTASAVNQSVDSKETESTALNPSISEVNLTDGKEPNKLIDTISNIGSISSTDISQLEPENSSTLKQPSLLADSSILNTALNSELSDDFGDNNQIPQDVKDTVDKLLSNVIEQGEQRNLRQKQIEEKISKCISKNAFHDMQSAYQAIQQNKQKADEFANKHDKNTLKSTFSTWLTTAKEKKEKEDKIVEDIQKRIADKNIATSFNFLHNTATQNQKRADDFHKSLLLKKAFYTCKNKNTNLKELENKLIFSHNQRLKTASLNNLKNAFKVSQEKTANQENLNKLITLLTRINQRPILVGANSAPLESMKTANNSNMQNPSLPQDTWIQPVKPLQNADANSMPTSNNQSNPLLATTSYLSKPQRTNATLFSKSENELKDIQSLLTPIMNQLNLQQLTLKYEPGNNTVEILATNSSNKTFSMNLPLATFLEVLNSSHSNNTLQSNELKQLLPADNQPEQLKGGLSGTEDIVSNSEELSTIPGQDAALSAISISANDIDSSDTDAPPSAVSLVHPKSDNDAYHNKHQNNVTSRPYSEGDTPLVDTKSPSNIALLSSDSVSDEIIPTGSSKSTITPSASSKMEEITSTTESSSSSSKGSSPAASAIAIDTSAPISSVKEASSEVISGTSTSDSSTSETENADSNREQIKQKWKQTKNAAKVRWDELIKNKTTECDNKIQEELEEEKKKLNQIYQSQIDNLKINYEQDVHKITNEYSEKIENAKSPKKFIFKSLLSKKTPKELENQRDNKLKDLNVKFQANINDITIKRDAEIHKLENAANLNEPGPDWLKSTAIKKLLKLNKDKETALTKLNQNKANELKKIKKDKNKELNPGLLGKAANFAHVVKDKIVNPFNKPKGKPNTAHPESTIESLKAPVYVEPHSTTIAMSDDSTASAVNQLEEIVDSNDTTEMANSYQPSLDNNNLFATSELSKEIQSEMFEQGSNISTSAPSAKITGVPVSTISTSFSEFHEPSKALSSSEVIKKNLSSDSNNNNLLEESEKDIAETTLPPPSVIENASANESQNSGATEKLTELKNTTMGELSQLTNTATGNLTQLKSTASNQLMPLSEIPLNTLNHQTDNTTKIASLQAAKAADAQKIEKLQTEKDQLNAKLKDSQIENDSLKVNKEKLEKEKTVYQQKIEQLKASNLESQQKLSQLQASSSKQQNTDAQKLKELQGATKEQFYLADEDKKASLLRLYEKLTLAKKKEEEQKVEQIANKQQNKQKADEFANKHKQNILRNLFGSWKNAAKVKNDASNIISKFAHSFLSRKRAATEQSSLAVEDNNATSLRQQQIITEVIDKLLSNVIEQGEQRNLRQKQIEEKISKRISKNAFHDMKSAYQAIQQNKQKADEFANKHKQNILQNAFGGLDAATKDKQQGEELLINFFSQVEKGSNEKNISEKIANKHDQNTLKSTFSSLLTTAKEKKEKEDKIVEGIQKRIADKNIANSFYSWHNIAQTNTQNQKRADDFHKSFLLKKAFYTCKNKNTNLKELENKLIFSHNQYLKTASLNNLKNAFKVSQEKTANQEKLNKLITLLTRINQRPILVGANSAPLESMKTANNSNMQNPSLSQDTWIQPVKPLQNADANSMPTSNNQSNPLLATTSYLSKPQRTNATLFSKSENELKDIQSLLTPIMNQLNLQQLTLKYEPGNNTVEILAANSSSKTFSMNLPLATFLKVLNSSHSNNTLQSNELKQLLPADNQPEQLNGNEELLIKFFSQLEKWLNEKNISEKIANKHNTPIYKKFFDNMKSDYQYIHQNNQKANEFAHKHDKNILFSLLGSWNNAAKAQQKHIEAEISNFPYYKRLKATTFSEWFKALKSNQKQKLQSDNESKLAKLREIQALIPKLSFSENANIPLDAFSIMKKINESDKQTTTRREATTYNINHQDYEGKMQLSPTSEAVLVFDNYNKVKDTIKELLQQYGMDPNKYPILTNTNSVYEDQAKIEFLENIKKDYEKLIVTPNKTLNDLTLEVKELEKQKNTLEVQNNTMTTRIKNLLKQNASLSSGYGQQRQGINSLDTYKRQLKTEIAKLERDLSEATLINDKNKIMKLLKEKQNELVSAAENFKKQSKERGHAISKAGQNTKGIPKFQSKINNNNQIIASLEKEINQKNILAKQQNSTIEEQTAKISRCNNQLSKLRARVHSSTDEINKLKQDIETEFKRLQSTDEQNNQHLDTTISNNSVSASLEPSSEHPDSITSLNQNSSVESPDSVNNVAPTTNYSIDKTAQVLYDDYSPSSVLQKFINPSKNNDDVEAHKEGLDLFPHIMMFTDSIPPTESLLQEIDLDSKNNDDVEAHKEDLDLFPHIMMFTESIPPTDSLIQETDLDSSHIKLLSHDLSTVNNLDLHQYYYKTATTNLWYKYQELQYHISQHYNAQGEKVEQQWEKKIKHAGLLENNEQLNSYQRYQQAEHKQLSFLTRSKQKALNTLKENKRKEKLVIKKQLNKEKDSNNLSD